MKSGLSRLAVAMILVLMPLRGSAEQTPLPVKGSDSPAFAELVGTWLAGDDIAALKGLADLARTGNTAAQILLGRIAADGVLHKHVTALLARKDRVALLRQPGGLSGTSWIQIAAAREPLARAFLQSARLGKKAEATRALFDLGEPYEAMRTGAGLVAAGEGADVLDALDGIARLPQEARYLVASARQFDGEDVSGSIRLPGPSENAVDQVPLPLRLAWVAPRPSAVVENAPLRAELEREAREVKTWQPLARFCAQECAASASSCLALGASLLGNRLFPFSSPSERLIPSEQYWQSARMLKDVAMRIRDLRSLGAKERDEFAAVDACLVPAVVRYQSGSVRK